MEDAVAAQRESICGTDASQRDGLAAAVREGKPTLRLSESLFPVAGCVVSRCAMVDVIRHRSLVPWLVSLSVSVHLA